MNVDIIHHYPPELTQLLIQTVPRLFRSKKDVLLFFKGAGVPASTLDDLYQKVNLDKDSISKFELVRIVITRINETGEATLRERREVLKRVIEFDDFSTCWDNDRLAAKGLVGEIQRVVDVKDSFTRMRQEAETTKAERAKEYRERIEKQNARSDKIAKVRNELFSLFSLSNPQARGKKLEAVLNDLFNTYGISVKDAFTLSDPDAGGIYEEVDGAIVLDGEVYLVEMKWTSDPIGTDLISPHLVRVFNRGSCRGIFISARGYTESGIHVIRQALQKAVFVLMGLEEITELLEKGLELSELLRMKVQAAITDREPLKKW